MVHAPSRPTMRFDGAENLETARRASQLSGGQQRIIAIVRTLPGNPSLLPLDEPSEGLAPLVLNAILQRPKHLKETGTTALISEQNLRFATELADRVSIIKRGEIRYEGARPAIGTSGGP